MCTYIQTMGQENSQYQDRYTVKPHKMLLVKFKKIGFIKWRNVLKAEPWKLQYVYKQFIFIEK